MEENYESDKMIVPYYEEEGIKLYLGDCLEVIKTIPDKSIDLIVADPPYNIKRDKWDCIENYFLWLESILIELKRILKEGHCLYLFQGYSFGAETKLLLDKHFNFLNWIVWFRIARGNYLNFTNAYEFCFLYSNGKWNKEFHKIMEKSYLKHKYGFKNIKIYFDEKEKKWYRERPLTNVWNIPEVCGNSKEKCSHTAQKPIDLFKIPILCSSNKNDLVLDPFLGSGTTLVVCKELGRQAIGIEINKEYCDIAIKRIKNTTAIL